MRREHANGPSAAVQHPGEAAGIGLDPIRAPIHGAILPGAEPEQDGPQALRAHAAENLVETGEVELALLRLDDVPVDRVLHGVQVHCPEGVPGAVHAIRQRAEVAHLSAQHDERLPVHQEGELVSRLDELWNGPALG